MKQVWEVKKLGEVCRISPPKSEIKEKKLSDKNIVSFLPMEDLHINEMYVEPIKSKFLSEVVAGYTYFATNDLLLAKVTPCFENGKLGIAKNLCNDVGFGSSEYIVIRVNENCVKPEYIYYVLSSTSFRNQGATFMLGASGLKRLPKDYVANYSLHVPSLPEQERIVRILDSAFAKIETLRANAEQNLKNAKELFQASLRQELSPKSGWLHQQINDVCDFYNGKAHENDIDKDGEYILVNSKYISSDCEIIKRTNKQLFPLYRNDIVMVMSDVPNGKTIAKCLLIDKDDSYSLNQRICAFRNSKINVELLRYLINRNSYLLSFDNGENQTNLRKNDILKCPLSYPADACNQQAIVEKLDALSERCRAMEENYRQTVLACDDLKQALLRKAFNGNL